MIKRTLIVIASLAMVLAACGGQAASPTPSRVPDTPTAVPNTPTAVASQPSRPSPNEPSQYTLDPAAVCQAFVMRPEPNPAIPPVSQDDWVKGSPDASVVLMEYGDYQ